MRAFRTLRSTFVSLPVESIDTDQIIPARFLTTTVRTGLGTHLFADWRYDAAGRPLPDFVLNRPGSDGAQILVTGSNFGCGSSREHAVWALADHGFRAVIASSFSDIFRRNALENGLLPVTVDAALVRDAHACARREGSLAIAIDLTDCTVTMPDGNTTPFTIDEFARLCLLAGLDTLDWLLREQDAIQRFEARHEAEAFRRPHSGRRGETLDSVASHA